MTAAGASEGVNAPKAASIVPPGRFFDPLQGGDSD
jgi:hypothetical protein